MVIKGGKARTSFCWQQPDCERRRRADLFSIEGEGGAIIQDFDAVTENCFCDDVIQVDGNKMFYGTYDYKSTKELYTSASSWAGNIKVKAVAAPTNCEVGTGTTFNAAKTAFMTTAVVK